MKARYAIGLALLSGTAFGAIAVQTLHAEAKLPAYAIVDNDVSDQAAYLKEFAPLGGKALVAAGGKILARGGTTVSIEGEPPKGRALVVMFESLEMARAAFASPAYREARKIGDKYAKFRIWAVEGAAP